MITGSYKPWEGDALVTRCHTCQTIVFIAEPTEDMVLCPACANFAVEES